MNMCQEIKTLRRRLQHNAEEIDRLSMNDIQNEELADLIRSIQKSDHGQQELQSIYREAEETGTGKGDLLRSIWDQDVADIDKFYQDQHSNS